MNFASFGCGMPTSLAISAACQIFAAVGTMHSSIQGQLYNDNGLYNDLIFN